MTTATDTDIKEIKTAIEANTKAIAELTTEMRVGFAQVDTKFAHLEGKLDAVEAKLEGKISVVEERTKLGFWGFIFRGTALAFLAALTAIFVKYLFPILPPELPKF